MFDTSKRIGILTFHFSTHNFGAVLQAYASYINLKEMGFEPEFINANPTTSNIGKRILSRVKAILTRAHKFDQFRAQYLPIGRKIESDLDFRKLNDTFQIFYVGSDQVWRPSTAGNLVYRYFLDFVDDSALKVSYAPSFGVGVWSASESMTNKISTLMKRFDSISVREPEAVNICRDIFNVNAVQVLDPTLLIRRKHYDLICGDKNELTEKPYIAYYVLSDKLGKRKDEKLSNIPNNYSVINIYGRVFSFLPLKWLRYNYVHEWLSGIKHSSIVVTDSYHGVLFSIIYHKQFVCIENQHRGMSRISGILKLVSLTKRLCMDEKIDVKAYLNDVIDYNDVDSNLQSSIEQSKTYLHQAFEGR